MQPLGVHPCCLTEACKSPVHLLLVVDVGDGSSKRPSAALQVLERKGLNQVPSAFCLKEVFQVSQAAPSPCLHHILPWLLLLSLQQQAGSVAKVTFCPGCLNPGTPAFMSSQQRCLCLPATPWCIPPNDLIGMSWSLNPKLFQPSSYGVNGKSASRNQGL